MKQDMLGRAKLRLFGSPCLIGGAGQHVALPAKAYVLALYLLTSGQSPEISRAQAACFLWPDAPNPAGNLRQFLRRLKADQHDAGVDLFVFDSASIRLDLGKTVVDLLALRDAIAALDWSSSQVVLDIYRGGLLAEADVPETDLARWLDAQRAETRNQLVAAMVRLLERPDARANPHVARAVAARLLEIDSSEEAAYRSLMQLFANEGQLPAVTATFQKCRTVLDKEFSTTPSEQTVALYRTLVPAARPAEAARLAALDAPAPARAFEDLVRRATLPRLIIFPPPRVGADEEPWDMATLVLDDVVITLCSLRTISVVPSHTSTQLSHVPLDRETTDKFNISYVLHSELRRAASASRLYVQLADTGSEPQLLWAETYKLDEKTTAGCHKGLAVHITRSLADAVERTELDRFARDDNPQAYYWHLYGQKHLRFMDLPSIRRAVKAFRNSLAADPDFAPAHSGKARAIQREWLVLGRGDPQLLNEAEQSGLKAVSLDHRDARGYRELGLCSLYRRRWDDAVANFSEAERLSPQYADLISDFGDTLGHCGEPELGLTKIERAMELNPIPPDQYWWNAAGLHFQLHQYREAIAAVERMGHTLPALRIAAAAWAYLGEKEQAKRCSREFLESYPDFRIDHWLSIVPDRRADDRRHYELGLRSAGFQ